MQVPDKGVDAVQLAERHGDQLMAGAEAEKAPERKAAYALAAIQAYEWAIDHTNDNGVLYEKGIEACNLSDESKRQIISEEPTGTTIEEIIRRSDINVKIAAFNAYMIAANLPELGQKLNHYARIAHLRGGYLEGEDAYKAMHLQYEYLATLSDSIKQMTQLLPAIFDAEMKERVKASLSILQQHQEQLNN